MIKRELGLIWKIGINSQYNNNNPYIDDDQEIEYVRNKYPDYLNNDDNWEFEQVQSKTKPPPYELNKYISLDDLLKEKEESRIEQGFLASSIWSKQMYITWWFFERKRRITNW